MHQRLAQNPLQTPDQIVAWLGAVQAQDYLGAKWSLGLRMQQATDDLIEQALTNGTILRTHVLRPTWHLVTPADIRWLLALTAPRVHAMNASRYRQLELDEAVFRRSNTVLVKALQGGQMRTRAELGAMLAEAGIAAAGPRLSYIMMRAELDGVVCSGPRRGKQFTYALLDERAPHAPVLQREEALAELTQRYYTGHGPATVHDFVWWSGLTMADAKVSLDMVASKLSQHVIDGHTYYSSRSLLAAVDHTTGAFLLPTYDEFLVGFAGFDAARRGGRGTTNRLVFESAIMVEGQIVGSWRRMFKKGGVRIELAPFAPLTATDDAAITAAAQQYGAFVGMPVHCTIVHSSERTA